MRTLLMDAFEHIKEVDSRMPELNEGEVLLKVKFIGICGSDLHVYKAEHPTAAPPLVLGHEFCGEVSDIRSNRILDFTIGDLVVAHPLTSCGTCEHCVAGRQNLCKEISIFGVHQDGTYTEYVKAAVDKVIKIKSDIDAEVAALAEPLSVAVHDVLISGLAIGESVLIIGAGTIGLLIASVAKMNGASNIVLCEIDQKRIKFAEEMGFNVIDSSSPNNMFERTMQQNMGERFDRVFEVTGSEFGYKTSLKAAKSGGTIVFIGFPEKLPEMDTNEIIMRELVIKGVRIHPLNHFQAAAKIINTGIINDSLKKLISRVYLPEEIEKAFSDIQKDKSIIKALIKFS